MIGIILIIILDFILLFILFRKNKKYPFGFIDYALIGVTVLLALFISGMLNGLTEDILLYFMKGKYTLENGIPHWYTIGDKLKYNCIFFIFVAIVEETTKHILLFVQIRKKTVRTYLDCVLSFILVSALFSVLEDISYYINYGSSVGIPRLISELAGHIMYSMIVGECYYKYLIQKKIAFMHSYLQEYGYVDKSVVVKTKTISIFIKGFSLALILHFLYNFIVSSFIDEIGYLCIIAYTIVFIVKYIKALKNPLIVTVVAEKYEKMQFEIKKEEIYSILLNKSRNG